MALFSIGTAIGMIIGAIVGAAIGGIAASITGGDLETGMLYGAIGGAVLGGLSGANGVFSSSSSSATSGGGYAVTTDVGGLQAAEASAGVAVDTSVSSGGFLSDISSGLGDVLGGSGDNFGSQLLTQVGGEAISGWYAAELAEETSEDTAEENEKNRQANLKIAKMNNETSLKMKGAELEMYSTDLAAKRKQWRDEFDRDTEWHDQEWSDMISQRTKASEALEGAKAVRVGGRLPTQESLLSSIKKQNDNLFQSEIPTLDGNEVTYAT